MFEYGGKNEFKGYFDPFEWNAPLYEDSSEVCGAFSKLDLCGKKVTAIYTIGCCEDIGESIEHDLYSAIRNAGIEPGLYYRDDYERIDEVLVPWNVSICEPIQFVFDDNSTLEILPIERGAARIGINSIPPGLINGLNKGELDASDYFQEFIGRELQDIDVRIRKKEEQFIRGDGKKPYSEIRTEYVIKINFEDSLRMELIQKSESWYEIKVTRGIGYQYIPYKRVKSSYKKVEQIPIVNGRDSGGVLLISSFSREANAQPYNVSLDSFKISIDELYVDEFLTVFLLDVFDESIQRRDEFEEPDFDWYGSNLYTIQSVETMIRTIRLAMDLLKTDFDNPVLSCIKNRWSVYDYTDKRKDELSDEELNELRRKRLPVVLDFYDRFCTQMEHTMDIPNHDMVAFTGP